MVLNKDGSGGWHCACLGDHVCHLEAEPQTALIITLLAILVIAFIPLKKVCSGAEEDGCEGEGEAHHCCHCAQYNNAHGGGGGGGGGGGRRTHKNTVHEATSYACHQHHKLHCTICN